MNQYNKVGWLILCNVIFSLFNLVKLIMNLTKLFALGERRGNAFPNGNVFHRHSFKMPITTTKLSMIDLKKRHNEVHKASRIGLPASQRTLLLRPGLASPMHLQQVTPLPRSPSPVET